MSDKKIFYYRIFDDKDETNYIRTSLNNEQFRELLMLFEQNHDQYFNSEFFEFLKKEDSSAEIIEITNIYY